MRQIVFAIAITVIAADAAYAQSGGKAAAQQHDSKMDHQMMLMDADFAYLTAQHHRDGIEMSKLEESSGASAQVKSLAAKIRQGQERELPTLTQYGSKANKGGMVAAHEKQMQQESQASMARLKAASGADLDRVFIDEMSKHHQKALEMVKEAHLSDAKLKQLVDRMAAEQKREIEELKKAQ